MSTRLSSMRGGDVFYLTADPTRELLVKLAEPTIDDHTVVQEDGSTAPVDPSEPVCYVGRLGELARARVGVLEDVK